MKFDSIDAWMEYLREKAKQDTYQADNDDNGDNDDVDQYEDELNRQLDKEGSWVSHSRQMLNARCVAMHYELANNINISKGTDMIPDEQIAQDLSIGVCLFIFVITAVALLKDYGGYLPADECANRVIDTLSPYQVHQLTNSSYPARYNEVRTWCDLHSTDWERSLKAARSYRELPDLLDMNIN